MKKITYLLFLALGTLSFNFASAQSPCNANGTLTPTGNPGEFTITDLSTAGNSPYSFFTPGVAGSGNYVGLQPSTTTATFQYTQNGNYSYGFSVYDSIAGCSDFFWDSITVTGINPVPCQAAFTILQDSTNPSIFWYWNTSIGSSPAIGLDYLWDFGDGTTSTAAYPTHLYNSLGVFTICLTITEQNSTFACTSTICDTIIVSVKASGTTLNVLPPGATASIEKIESLSGLSIYPNPTEENFVIEMSSKNNGEIAVSIVNLAGQNELTTSFNILEGSNKIELNSNNLNAGVYFVKITDLDSNSTQTLRLIKR